MKKITVVLFLSLITSFLIAQIHLLTTHTLEKNGNWNIGKQQIEMGVMGAYNFATQTQPLNNSMIDLGAWHGFQEIYTKDAFIFDEISFDTKLDEKAYLYAYVIDQNFNRYGFELGKTDNSIRCLQIDSSGKFVQETQKAPVEIKNEEWFNITINKDAKEFHIQIHDQSFTCKIPLEGPYMLGFKNGLQHSYIDSIEIRNEGKRIFTESFSPTIGSLQLTMRIYLYVLIVTILLGVSLFVIRKKTKQLLVLTVIHVSLILTLLLSYFYLSTYFVGNYPNVHSILSLLQSQENTWVDNELTETSDKIMDEYQENTNDKILFIGSSQTWGAGASTNDTTAVALFHTFLQDHINQTLNAESTDSAQVFVGSTQLDQNVTTINTGVSGTTSNELLSMYEKHWIHLKPKMVLINLSSNDFTYGIPEDVFKKNIEQFISLNNTQDIETILIIEAHSLELERENTYHDILRNVAQEKGVQLIDMHSYLKSLDDTGIVWWDFVHLTDYGHQRMAEHLFNELILRPHN